MSRRTDPQTDGLKREWELRSNVPERVALCEAATVRENLGYDVCWHTTGCLHYRRAHSNGQPRDGWLYNLPVSLVLQTWESATSISPVGFCQQCLIKKVA